MELIEQSHTDLAAPVFSLCLSIHLKQFRTPWWNVVFIRHMQPVFNKEKLNNK